MESCKGALQVLGGISRPSYLIFLVAVSEELNAWMYVSLFYSEKRT